MWMDLFMALGLLPTSLIAYCAFAAVIVRCDRGKWPHESADAAHRYRMLTTGTPDNPPLR
jgi:hypothetical protein